MKYDPGQARVTDDIMGDIMNLRHIPISAPVFGKNTQKYLLDCIQSGWVSSKGTYVDRFEKKFASFTGSKYAIATSSGTSAIHLALAALQIGPGDEVIVPSLTMIASVLPIIYVGARPVLVDSETQTGNIDTIQISHKISRKTKAIIVVHLHGHMAHMAQIIPFARKHNLAIIEDAAEAHGASYNGQPAGGMGDVGCFSFYGNKIVTTGEGGMVVTNYQKIADRARSLRNLDRAPGRHFVHNGVGFAYRMSNIQAALGVAQLEDIQAHINRKRAIAVTYARLLKDIPYLELPHEEAYAKSVFWQYGVLISKSSPVSRDELETMLAKNNIETRRFFTPMHKQPAFRNLGFFKSEHYPVAEDLSNRGLCLPSGLTITDEEIKYVCEVIRKALQ